MDRAGGFQPVNPGGQYRSSIPAPSAIGRLGTSGGAETGNFVTPDPLARVLEWRKSVARIVLPAFTTSPTQ
ncbi:hypothetical protein ACIA8K_38535 [Catenuloplanes sp. NPDC051500]|uniref:hypothetical protein n=1 Tax=Catenuloplanes sp. NPDC051500 TaxID=3363959 RepID=UPI0037B005BB